MDTMEIDTPFLKQKQNTTSTDIKYDNQLIATIQKQLQELEITKQIEKPKYRINDIVQIKVYYCCPTIIDQWNVIESKDQYKIIDILFNQQNNSYNYVCIEINRLLDDYLLNGINSKTIIIKSEQDIIKKHTIENSFSRFWNK